MINIFAKCWVSSLFLFKPQLEGLKGQFTLYEKIIVFRDKAFYHIMLTPAKIATDFNELDFAILIVLFAMLKDINIYYYKERYLKYLTVKEQRDILISCYIKKIQRVRLA